MEISKRKKKKKNVSRRNRDIHPFEKLKNKEGKDTGARTTPLIRLIINVCV